MIFITGDTHADFNRFSTKSFPEQRNMTKDDFVIICGDFGGLWDDSAREHYWLDWLEDKPFTTLFVSGNHENYDMLKDLPWKVWNSGTVNFIRPSVIHLRRGQIFHLQGKKFFTFGGARSHDISDGILSLDDPDFRSKYDSLRRKDGMFRIDHVSWWKEEMPNRREMHMGRMNLIRANHKVDYIITHDCPTDVQYKLGYGRYEPDKFTDYLERDVEHTTDFQHWYFGHYHTNRDIGDRFTCMYHEILRIL